MDSLNVGSKITKDMEFDARNIGVCNGQAP
jgi:hypothetical protein